VLKTVELVEPGAAQQLLGIDEEPPSPIEDDG
jgi:hypothetical protein